MALPAPAVMLDAFDRQLDERGWIIFPAALPESQVASLRADCLKWVDICTRLQVAAGINAQGDGTAHHAIGGGDSIDAFVQQHLFDPYLAHFFGGRPYILHACNPVGGFPGRVNYVHKLHRDTATFIPGFPFRMNMLVMLDEFRLDNGATRVLGGSHRNPACPDDASFDAGSEAVLGPAGSVVLFNSYLWHKGTLNTSAENRVALTLSYGPAFIKPQMDYARLLGEERGRALSALSRQVLGFNARVPVSLEEWYKPREQRLYHADQG